MDLEEILDLPPAELQQFLGGVEPDPALEAGLPKLPIIFPKPLVRLVAAASAIMGPQQGSLLGYPSFYKCAVLYWDPKGTLI